MDVPVSNLQAKYLFLPYGTLLSKGETVRIWMENGKTRVVLIEEKIKLLFSGDGPTPLEYDRVLPWELIAFDSGIEIGELMHWQDHPLYNPDTTSVVLVFSQIIEVPKTFKDVLRSWLYRIRTL
ncbi:hypothetical protein [Hydrogenovibrio kuenenii]|uniref:hypothetical protein n=1 Tax=Hydrogenovibrio kuenenii TaxID=63658 RepID=UPI001FDF0734|nr:hypothetical protein [Hydrogenovibrio kuenenii]